MKRTANLDMDGFLADFEGHFLARTGIDSNTISSPEVCKHLAEMDDFFDDVPILPGAQEFFYYACTRSHLEVVILTSCPVSCFAQAAAAKRRWIRKHFGGISVIPVPGSRNKPVYMQRAGDLLIDDWGRNIDDWRAAGGVGIKHENDFGLTTQLFNEWMWAWNRAERIA